jgi:hypothetical protein
VCEKGKSLYKFSRGVLLRRHHDRSVARVIIDLITDTRNLEKSDPSSNQLLN